MDKPKIFEGVTSKELIIAALRAYRNSPELALGINCGYRAVTDDQTDAESYLAGAILAGGSNSIVEGIKLGMAIAGPDGWKYIAPAWLDEE